MWRITAMGLGAMLIGAGTGAMTGSAVGGGIGFKLGLGVGGETGETVGGGMGATTGKDVTEGEAPATAHHAPPQPPHCALEGWQSSL